jgi:hypothetical protein
VNYIKVVLLVVIGACKTGPSQAAIYAAGAEQEVVSAEQAWVSSTVRKDADAFASLMHDNWIGYVEGRLIEKSEWTNSIRKQTERLDSVQVSNRKVRFPARDVAVVTGSFVTRSRIRPGFKEHVTTGTYVNNWVRTGAGWQLVSGAFKTILSSR